MIMKALKLTLAAILFIGGCLMAEDAAISITATGTALGWLYAETKKSRRYAN